MVTVASSDGDNGETVVENPNERKSAVIATEDDPIHGTLVKKDWWFWSIIACLGITSVLAAIDATIITTALPAIVAMLSGGEKYVWVIGAYFLSSTALQPIYGQTANIFGRRNLIIFAVVVFTLGSGICGGATNMDMMIFGRTIQGIGGGINVLVELIVCDLVPLRERGSYTAIIFSAAIIGSAIGPWIGGIFTENATWRWCFYINIPIGGVALIMLILLLRVGHKKSTTKDMLKRVDFAGNAIFVGAILALMFALVYGGVKYPWSSWQVVVPLTLELCGVVIFALFECSQFCIEPTMPQQLFSNRTSVAALVLTVIHSSMMTYVIYFLSVYFQAVRQVLSAACGVDLLPTVLGFTPAAAIAGVLLAKFGRYRPYHMVGFAIMAVGIGIYSLLSPTTPTIGWVLLQIFFAIGCGIVMPSLLPVMQAELSELDTATSTATIVCSELRDNLGDIEIRAILVGGQAYSHGTSLFINSLSGITRTEVIWTYNEALKMVWYAGIAFCSAGFFIVFFEKEIKLRTELETEFSMVTKEKKSSEVL